MGTGQGWGGINIKQVLSNARKARINEEEKECIQNILSVPSPKQGEVRNTTGALPQIVSHAGYYCCLCETSFGDDDDVMVDDKWVYCPVCFIMSHVSSLKYKKCMCGFKPKRNQLR